MMKRPDRLRHLMAGMRNTKPQRQDRQIKRISLRRSPKRWVQTSSKSSECNRLLAYRSYLYLLVQGARSESEMSSLIDEQPARTKKNGKANGSGKKRTSEVRSCRCYVMLILVNPGPNQLPLLVQGQDLKPKVSLRAFCIPVASPVWIPDTCVISCSNTTETTSDK